MQNSNRWLTIPFLVVSFVGFLDATYLTALRYLGETPPCIITTGCEQVLTSEYATLFGTIPTALLGAGYYLALFLLVLLSVELGSRKVLALAALLSPVGLLTSVFFVYLQLFVLKAICFYCMISAATSTILFILGTLMLFGMRGVTINKK